MEEADHLCTRIGMLGSWNGGGRDIIPFCPGKLIVRQSVHYHILSAKTPVVNSGHYFRILCRYHEFWPVEVPWNPDPSEGPLRNGLPAAVLLCPREGGRGRELRQDARPSGNTPRDICRCDSPTCGSPGCIFHCII